MPIELELHLGAPLPNHQGTVFYQQINEKSKQTANFTIKQQFTRTTDRFQGDPFFTRLHIPKVDLHQRRPDQLQSTCRREAHACVVRHQYGVRIFTLDLFGDVAGGRVKKQELDFLIGDGIVVLVGACDREDLATIGMVTEHNKRIGNF